MIDLFEKPWCQAVLPQVYDDSLSYYEVLGKIGDKLNEVIKDQNALRDTWDDYQKALNKAWQDFQNSINSQIADFKTAWTDYQKQLNNAWQVFQNKITNIVNNLADEWEATKEDLAQKLTEFTTEAETLKSEWEQTAAEWATTKEAWADMQADFTNISNAWATYQTNINKSWADYQTTINAEVADLASKVNGVGLQVFKYNTVSSMLSDNDIFKNANACICYVNTKNGGIYLAAKDTMPTATTSIKWRQLSATGTSGALFTLLTEPTLSRLNRTRITEDFINSVPSNFEYIVDGIQYCYIDANIDNATIKCIDGSGLVCGGETGDIYLTHCKLIGCNVPALSTSYSLIFDSCDFFDCTAFYVSRAKTLNTSYFKNQTNQPPAINGKAQFYNSNIPFPQPVADNVQYYIYNTHITSHTISLLGHTIDTLYINNCTSEQAAPHIFRTTAPKNLIVQNLTVTGTTSGQISTLVAPDGAYINLQNIKQAKTSSSYDTVFFEISGNPSYINIENVNSVFDGNYTPWNITLPTYTPGKCRYTPINYVVKTSTSTNYDTLTETGIYEIPNTSTDVPTTLIVSKPISDITIQFAIVAGLSYLKVRQYSGGAWGAWRYIVTQTDPPNI